MTCIWNGNLHGWESQQKQQAQLKAVPTSRSLDRSTQNPGNTDEHTWFVVKLRIGPVTASLKEMTDVQLKENSHLTPWSNMCTSRLTLKEQKIFTFKGTCTAQEACAATSKDMCQWAWINQPKSIKFKLGLFHCQWIQLLHIPGTLQSTIIPWFYANLWSATWTASQY